MRLRSRLAKIVEPDFGLLDELLCHDVLTLPQVVVVQSQTTVYMRNTALLELLTSEDQCDKFVTALKATMQQHVVNFIEQNGGERRYDIVTCRLDVVN